MNEIDFFKNDFVRTASGVSLDRLGLNYGVERKIGEDDESYRARIIPIWEKCRPKIIGDNNGTNRQNC